MKKITMLNSLERSVKAVLQQHFNGMTHYVTVYPEPEGRHLGTVNIRKHKNLPEHGDDVSLSIGHGERDGDGLQTWGDETNAVYFPATRKGIYEALQFWLY